MHCMLSKKGFLFDRVLDIILEVLVHDLVCADAFSKQGPQRDPLICGIIRITCGKLPYPGFYRESFQKVLGKRRRAEPAAVKQRMCCWYCGTLRIPGGSKAVSFVYVTRT